MKTILYLFFLISSCKAQHKSFELKWHNNNSFSKDIPVDKKNQLLYDTLIDQKFSSVFSIDTLIKGVDSFEIRIWFDNYKKEFNNRLVQFFYKENNWHLNFYDFDFSYDESKSLYIPDKVKKTICPLNQSSIEIILKSIINNKILNIRDQYEMNNYPVMVDCSAIRIELANSNSYRTYGYECINNIDIKKNFEEVQLLENFINLINSFAKLKK